MTLLQELEDYAGANSVAIAPTTDLVLDLFHDETDKVACDYYFADHKLRSVFWLDEFHANTFSVWNEVKGVTSDAQVGMIFQPRPRCSNSHILLQGTSSSLNTGSIANSSPRRGRSRVGQ